LKHPSLGVDYHGGDGYIKWTSLTVMDLSYNSLVSIDTSLNLCPNLEELNLCHNKIKDIDNLLDLPHLRILDLSYNELCGISDLHCRLGNITTLCLSHNSLSSLSGLEKCYSIVVLDIQNNLIAKVGEISRLSSLPILEQLMVKGNAFTASPSFRQQVFSLLPHTSSQISLDGKPASKDELEVSASISTADTHGKSKKHKKSSTRRVNVDNDVEDSYSEDMGVGGVMVPTIFAGARRNIEQMRKEEGENWLKKLNEKQPPESMTPTGRTHKKKHKQRRTDNDGTAAPDDNDVPQTPSSGLPSCKLQELVTNRECNSPWSCTATVLTYSGNFRQMSHYQIDHFINSTSSEECMLEVDVNVGKIVEDLGIAGGKNRSRRTRDLTFLKDVRTHEGKKHLAIIIELSTLVSHTQWILYCVKDYPSIADFYVLLHKSLHSNNAPPSPACLSRHLTSVEDDDGGLKENQVASPQVEVISDKGSSIPVDTGRAIDLDDDIIPISLGSVLTPPNFLSDDDDSYKSTLDDLSFTENPSIKPLDPIVKPGLDSDTLHHFFTNKVAKSADEILMYVIWCSVSLPSTYPYEVQGSMMISNTNLYILEIKRDERDKWNTEDLPLLVIVSEQLDHLSRVVLTGIQDQNIYIKLHDKSPVGSFIVFPPTSELTSQLFEQLKAALDSSSLHYNIIEHNRAKQVVGLSDILFVTPDAHTIDNYKLWLSDAKTRVRLANFVSINKNKSLLGMYEMELKQGARQLADAFDVIYQIVVCVVCNDVMAGNNGSAHFQPHQLILTNSYVYLCQEPFISKPSLHSTRAKHTFPSLYLSRIISIKTITSISLCVRPLLIADETMHQLCITYSNNSSLYLATHSLQYLERFIKALQRQCDDAEDASNKVSVSRLTSEIPSFPKPLFILPATGGKSKVTPPLFIESPSILRFAALPHWKKVLMFKEYFAQGDFMKSDETLLSIFMAHSQPLLEKTTQIELCVIVSNYAIYFLSDVAGIKTWLDAGGNSSFARMSLLNSQNDVQLQCFYRIWLADLISLKVGPFLLSVRVYEGKCNSYIDILTTDAQCVRNFMSSLAASVGFNRETPEKDIENILEGFVDVTDDVFGSMTTDLPDPTHLTKRSIIELMLPSDAHLNDLKLHLVESHPDVARGSSITKCSESIQFLFTSVMLLAEQVRVRETMIVTYRPHLFLLTNFGLFVCGNSLNAEMIPSLLILTSSQLVVKRWIRIDDIQRVQVARDPQYHAPQVFIYTRGNESDFTSIHLCVVPSTQAVADVFVTFIDMTWEEKMGKPLLLQYLD
jgi:hypothetical protein